uniref:Peptidase A2 domain-containing protein n=1 Tax=Romanomermis culicivorax TaxID=13658 RepID=A0A915JRB5_ROMCU
MPNPHQRTFEPTLTILAVSRIGVHDAEHFLKEVHTPPAVQETMFTKNTYAFYLNANFTPPWEQHIYYNAVPAPYVTTPMYSSRTSLQSSELPLMLPALLSTSTVSATNSKVCAISQTTSTANMITPSKEIASAAPIISPGIICWNATNHPSHDPCHICPSVCQMDNLTPSTKTFIHKYTSRRAFQYPIKLGAINAHTLMDTGAQCSVLSSGLVKCLLDKQSLQLPICGKIKVANSAILNAQGSVVVTMESAFREHMTKCLILDNDNNDQCIFGANFLLHPDIHPNRRDRSQTSSTTPTT